MFSNSPDCPDYYSIASYLPWSSIVGATRFSEVGQKRSDDAPPCLLAIANAASSSSASIAPLPIIIAETPQIEEPIASKLVSY
nr:hypothetical protein [Nostoc sp. LPT]